MTKITLTKPKITVDGKLLDLSQPDPQALAAPVTIDITPTWSGILLALVAVLQSGSAEGQAIALDELRRMAALDELRRMAALADSAKSKLNLTNYTLTQETAFEIVEALRVATDRLSLNDCEGEEQPFIEMVEGALARLYALPGLLDAMDPNAAGDE